MSMVECSYCGLPVPGARVSAQPSEPQGPQYCCYGCDLAARITQAGPGDAPTSLTRARTLLGIAIFLTMNVMVVNWMLYGQEVYNPDGPSGSTLGATTIALFRYLSLLFGAPVLVILGWPIMRGGLHQLRAGRITADLLISIGVTAAYLISYIAVMRESGGTYFDTVCMILVLVTLGKYLEATAKIRTTSALHELESLVPKVAIVIRGREHVELAAGDLSPGDVMFIRPGCRVPADGVIAENESHVDEQIITGESAAVHKRPGDRVFAGSLNGEGALVAEVAAAGVNTVLHEVIELLLAARREKGRYERLADRLASVFVPGVLVVAVLAAAYSWRAIGVDAAIMRALAVLLISCPCALGLATPMVVWVALGQAARRGVLFRNVAALELLAKVRTICFDKTGTLTSGRAAVTAFDTLGDTAGNAAAARDEVLAVASGLARGATHHLSAGIERYAAGLGVSPAPVADAQTVPGRGVSGVVCGRPISAEGGGGDNPGGRPSRAVSLGSPAFMEEQGLACAASLAAVVEQRRREGHALACVGWDGAVRGVFSFAEDVRPEAGGVLRNLRSHGVALFMLTGDHQHRAGQLAEELGLEVEAELLPADKIARVRGLAASAGPVAMVGDGINDAPALAAADVGIAMGCGADVTRESADVTLASNDLRALWWALRLSARTVRVIKQNLFWAFAYNTIGIALAFSGKLSPIFAALAMVVSSLLVVGNSLRLNRVDSAAD